MSGVENFQQINYQGGGGLFWSREYDNFDISHVKSALPIELLSL